MLLTGYFGLRRGKVLMRRETLENNSVPLIYFPLKRLHIYKHTHGKMFTLTMTCDQLC